MTTAQVPVYTLYPADGQGGVERTVTQHDRHATNGGGFNPGPWAPGGFVTVGGRRYRVWHVALPHRPGGARDLPDRAWGVIISDRVAPRGTMHILDHVPTISVATY